MSSVKPCLEYRSIAGKKLAKLCEKLKFYSIYLIGRAENSRFKLFKLVGYISLTRRERLFSYISLYHMLTCFSIKKSCHKGNSFLILS